MGKGEIVPDEQFLLHAVFSTRLQNFQPFSSSSKLSSANTFNLEVSEILSFVKGLTSMYNVHVFHFVWCCPHFFSFNCSLSENILMKNKRFSFGLNY